MKRRRKVEDADVASEFRECDLEGLLQVVSIVNTGGPALEHPLTPLTSTTPAQNST